MGLSHSILELEDYTLKMLVIVVPTHHALRFLCGVLEESRSM